MDRHSRSRSFCSRGGRPLQSPSAPLAAMAYRKASIHPSPWAWGGRNNAAADNPKIVAAHMMQRPLNQSAMIGFAPLSFRCGTPGGEGIRIGPVHPLDQFLDRIHLLQKIQVPDHLGFLII